MGRARIRLHCLRTGHAKPRVRVCSSFSDGCKSSSASIKYVNRTEFSSNVGDDRGSDNAEKGADIGNKIMVVVDSSLEAKGALEWALSHTVQSRDTVILVHVAKSPRQVAESTGNFNLNAYQLLLDMKNLCEMTRPGVQVKIVILEGEEKGPAVVEEAKQQRASLLVIGQRKRPILWRLVKRWVRKRTGIGVVEYCIQNAACMTIAVRRKNKKLGGYLITTKRHKNFWLLA